jgi:hypothetical protein
MEVATGQGKGQSRTATQAPGAVRRFGRVPRELSRNAERAQFTIATPAPLFPEVAAQPRHDPLVQFLEPRQRLTEPEVVRPALQVHSQLCEYFAQTHPARAPSDLAHLVFEACNRSIGHTTSGSGAAR